MRRLFETIVALTLVACGDDGGTTGPADTDAEATSGSTASHEESTGTSTGLADGSSGDASTGGEMPNADDLYERGPYEVGYRELEMTYRPPWADEDRIIPMSLWYPAAEDSGADPAVYALGGIVELPSGTALDAPPVNETGAFPTVVYSHGSGGVALVAYPYAEHFASHGWVVLAPNHTGNTALDALEDTTAPYAANVVNRPSDITATLDWMEDGVPGDLAGVADLDRVFLFGHSFGGYTTFASGGALLDADALIASCVGEDCDVYGDPDVEAALRSGFTDARIDALAPQAPALIPSFEGESLGELSVPTMLMSGRLDQTTTQQGQAEPAWAALGGDDDIWVEMPNGAHFTFITVCDDLEPSLIELFQPGAEMDGCGPGFIPVSEAIPTLTAYMLAFANAHVLGQTAYLPLITGAPLADGFEITLPQ